MTTTETELEKTLCVIAYKAYKLLPEDYHPLLWLYKEQRNLCILIELQEMRGKDEGSLNELRREYHIARSRYLQAMQEQDVYVQKSE